MSKFFASCLMDRDSIPIVTAYYYKQWNRYEMKDHTHRSMEIMYVIKGTCNVEVGEIGKNRKSVTLKKGEFIFLDGTVPHRLIVEHSCRMLNVEFGFTKAKNGTISIEQLAIQEPTLSALLQCAQPFLLFRDQHNVYQTLRNLVIELDSTKKREVMVHILLMELLLRIAELYREQQEDDRFGKEEYIRKVIEYMNEYYDQPLSISGISKIVNLHPSYVQKIFKQVTGKSIAKYLMMYRMEKAKMFLSQTELPIIEISDYVGVGSRQYFHYVFREYTGMTPVDYRNSVITAQSKREQQ